MFLSFQIDTCVVLTVRCRYQHHLFLIGFELTVLLIPSIDRRVQKKGMFPLIEIEFMMVLTVCYTWHYRLFLGFRMDIFLIPKH